ncbi:D-serine deaminase-like pyridoxal phosphate-dependent protein [Pedobacter cryoconitis]|uniref:D-serine deaminase-like pyridoxal phosphate-dependent protein n=1 Tax=Pedobacter cryoconitis TaxID=188932 RepID=A0A7W9DJ32_9SPHI|nr:D-TA family PLP-dependent enzyme [Pedobacter cryoconitis]MBB5619720.1 D-serine deaminase-like pyridoxal phosphate-dependent protein [Pedobacter cryoconitis]
MSNMAADWYLIDEVEQLDSPALVFYQERITANIEKLKQHIPAINRLRPHVKTHKTVEITQQLLAAGITKFKCATIAEAEMLGLCKAPDVLLAYQPVGPKIDRFIQLIKTYPDTVFSCLIDNESSLKEIAHAATVSGVVIPVFLDLNVGMNRTGILPDEHALALYETAAAEKGVEILGLHAYDGHIHDADYALREKQAAVILASIDKLTRQLVRKGMAEPVIIAGGTPTFPIYAKLDSIECSPGTFVLWDKGYQDAFAEQDYLTAALVITRVISLTSATKITVDLGHKAVAAENLLKKRVHFLNAPTAEAVSQSEEHLVLELGSGHGFRIGDILYGLPVHICPTVALYGSANIINNHKLTEGWKIISRERKINI